MSARDLTFGDSGSWIKRIVVAADGSPASDRGLEQVANLAPRLGAEVTVVFVRHTPAAAMMAPGFANGSMDETLDELELEIRRQSFALLAGKGIEWEFVTRTGSAGEEIVKVADESGADLVVVASNRHSSLHNALLGSTAAYLATHSRAPVLVMRSKTDGSVGDPDASMALVPPSRDAFQRWEMTESSPGGARRRPEVLRGVPIGGKSS